MKTRSVRYIVGAICALAVVLTAGCAELIDIIVPPPQGPVYEPPQEPVGEPGPPDHAPAHGRRQKDTPGPPDHAPAHGRRRKELTETIRYFPRSEVYYSPASNTYYWFERDRWRSGKRLPKDIVLDMAEAVTLTLDAAAPFKTHAAVKAKHPGKGKKGKKGKARGQGKGKAWWK